MARLFTNLIVAESAPKYKAAALQNKLDKALWLGASADVRRHPLRGDVGGGVGSAGCPAGCSGIGKRLECNLCCIGHPRLGALGWQVKHGGCVACNE